MNSDLKTQLRELSMTGARQLEIGGKKVMIELVYDNTKVWVHIVISHHCFLLQAIIIFVPVPQLKAYQKIQLRLVRELEKKFSGKHVVFIAQRRILPKPTRKMKFKSKQKRPRR